MAFKNYLKYNNFSCIFSCFFNNGMKPSNLCSRATTNCNLTPFQIPYIYFLLNQSQHYPIQFTSLLNSRVQPKKNSLYFRMDEVLSTAVVGIWSVKLWLISRSHETTKDNL